MRSCGLLATPEFVQTPGVRVKECDEEADAEDMHLPHRLLVDLQEGVQISTSPRGGIV